MTRTYLLTTKLEKATDSRLTCYLLYNWLHISEPVGLCALDLHKIFAIFFTVGLRA